MAASESGTEVLPAAQGEIVEEALSAPSSPEYNAAAWRLDEAGNDENVSETSTQYEADPEEFESTRRMKQVVESDEDEDPAIPAGPVADSQALPGFERTQECVPHKETESEPSPAQNQDLPAFADSDDDSEVEAVVRHRPTSKRRIDEDEGRYATHLADDHDEDSEVAKKNRSQAIKEKLTKLAAEKREEVATFEDESHGERERKHKTQHGKTDEYTAVDKEEEALLDVNEIRKELADLQDHGEAPKYKYQEVDVGVVSDSEEDSLLDSEGDYAPVKKSRKKSKGCEPKPKKHFVTRAELEKMSKQRQKVQREMDIDLKKKECKKVTAVDVLKKRGFFARSSTTEDSTHSRRKAIFSMIMSQRESSQQMGTSLPRLSSDTNAIYAVSSASQSSNSGFRRESVATVGLSVVDENASSATLRKHLRKEAMTAALNARKNSKTSQRSSSTQKEMDFIGPLDSNSSSAFHPGNHGILARKPSDDGETQDGLDSHTMDVASIQGCATLDGEREDSVAEFTDIDVVRAGTPDLGQPHFENTAEQNLNAQAAEEVGNFAAAGASTDDAPKAIGLGDEWNGLFTAPEATQKSVSHNAWENTQGKSTQQGDSTTQAQEEPVAIPTAVHKSAERDEQTARETAHEDPAKSEPKEQIIEEVLSPPTSPGTVEEHSVAQQIDSDDEEAEQDNDRVHAGNVGKELQSHANPLIDGLAEEGEEEDEDEATGISRRKVADDDISEEEENDDMDKSLSSLIDDEGDDLGADEAPGMHAALARKMDEDSEDELDALYRKYGQDGDESRKKKRRKTSSNKQQGALREINGNKDRRQSSGSRFSRLDSEVDVFAELARGLEKGTSDAFVFNENAMMEDSRSSNDRHGSRHHRRKSSYHRGSLDDDLDTGASQLSNSSRPGLLRRDSSNNLRSLPRRDSNSVSNSSALGAAHGGSFMRHSKLRKFGTGGSSKVVSLHAIDRTCRTTELMGSTGGSAAIGVLVQNHRQAIHESSMDETSMDAHPVAKKVSMQSHQQQRSITLTSSRHTAALMRVGRTGGLVAAIASKSTTTSSKRR
eukprot:Clim_evm22s3 gene=Clim_evmTU22s3